MYNASWIPTWLLMFIQHQWDLEAHHLEFFHARMYSNFLLLEITCTKKSWQGSHTITENVRIAAEIRVFKCPNFYTLTFCLSFLHGTRLKQACVEVTFQLVFINLKVGRVTLPNNFNMCFHHFWMLAHSRWILLSFKINKYSQLVDSIILML